MANLATIETALGTFPSAQRIALVNAFRDVVKSLRLGRPVTGTPAENFAAGFYAATTPAVPGDEFSIAHEFGGPPYLAINVLDLRTAGFKTVPLEVSRVADARRIYLKSTVANAPVVLYVEG
jgi:hypothetical protein